MTMRRITGWIIGGLITLALWIPGAGAQDGRQMYQGMRHDWRDMRQDRRAGNYQDIRRDWRDIRYDHYRIWQDRRAGNYEALARDRAALWRDRAQLRADRRELWHDWRSAYGDRYNRW
jgi:hypothetical protein